MRLAVQALGVEAAFSYLRELRPLLWRGGATYPTDQAALEQLFASGEVDVAMSYNPNFVDVAVGRGTFRTTVRPYVFSDGTLSNVSFLAIPARSARPQGAMVVANLLLGADLQEKKLDQVGIPSVLAAERIAAQKATSVHRLDEYGRLLSELPADRVTVIDRRWLNEIGA